MPRWALIGLGCCLLVVIVGLVSRSDVTPPSTVDVAEPRSEVDGSPVSTARIPARTGSITGVVRHGGQGVGGARVSLKASMPLTVVTLDDGAFRIDGVPPEPVFLGAAKAPLASGVLGPFVVEPGKTLDGVTLELAPTVLIHGVVRDLVTRAPIPKATVTWSGGATQTAAQGTFELPAPQSQIWLDVLAPGFVPRTEWLSLELAREGGRLDLALSPVSVIEGQVLEQGTPRAQVSVWAELTEGVRRGERSMAVVTDKKGSFRIECSAGLRRVVAVTPAGVTVPGPEVRVATGETLKDVVVELGELGPLTGVVRRDGAAVSAAALTLVNAFTEDSVSSTSTLLDGRFAFGAVPAGRYLLQVRLGAFITMAGPFDHQRGGTPWEIDLKAGGVLEGRVEPASPGIRVRWRSGDWAGPSAELMTTGDGTFRFEGVPDAEVLVDAEGLDGAATVKARPGAPIVLRLERGAVIVRVVDESGAAVADATVLARSDDTGAVRKYALMAPDGVFQIDLPQGRWVLLAEVAGRGRTSAEIVGVTSLPAEVKLTLTATNPVRGRVVDKATKLPLQAARVRAESPMGKASVTTDPSGAFTLPPQPQQVTLTVGREGFEPQSFYLPSRPDAQNLVVELAPAPNRAFHDEAPRFEGVGMTLQVHEGRVVVQVVNEGSPAERAGVHSGDVIVSIEGQAAGGDLPSVVNRIRGPAGTPVRLGFERNGQTREVVIRRKSLLISYW